MLTTLFPICVPVVSVGQKMSFIAHSKYYFLFFFETEFCWCSTDGCKLLVFLHGFLYDTVPMGALQHVDVWKNANLLNLYCSSPLVSVCLRVLADVN